MSDLESNVVVKNTWGDMIQLENNVVKFIIKKGIKYSSLGDAVPEHPRGNFTFKLDILKIDEILFTKTSYRISGRQYGYIHIKSSMMKQYVKFPFDSDNKGWEKFTSLIQDRLTYNADRAMSLEKARDYDEAILVWTELRKVEEVKRIRKLQIEELKINKEYDKAIRFADDIGDNEETIRIKKLIANEREEALDYDNAIEIWEEVGNIEEAARVRKLKSEMGSVQVAQSIVQGDQITEIKDSVLNRSNVGGGSSKMQELKDLTEMKEKGLIDDDEFKQMKKEILGK